MSKVTKWQRIGLVITVVLLTLGLILGLGLGVFHWGASTPIKAPKSASTPTASSQPSPTATATPVSTTPATSLLTANPDKIDAVTDHSDCMGSGLIRQCQVLVRNNSTTEMANITVKNSDTNQSVLSVTVKSLDIPGIGSTELRFTVNETACDSTGTPTSQTISLDDGNGNSATITVTCEMNAESGGTLKANPGQLTNLDPACMVTNNPLGWVCKLQLTTTSLNMVDWESKTNDGIQLIPSRGSVSYATNRGLGTTIGIFIPANVQKSEIDFTAQNSPILQVTWNIAHFGCWSAQDAALAMTNSTWGATPFTASDVSVGADKCSYQLGPGSFSSVRCPTGGVIVYTSDALPENSVGVVVCSGKALSDAIRTVALFQILGYTNDPQKPWAHINNPCTLGKGAEPMAQNVIVFTKDFNLYSCNDPRIIFRAPQQ